VTQKVEGKRSVVLKARIAEMNLKLKKAKNPELKKALKAQLAIGKKI